MPLTLVSGGATPASGGAEREVREGAPEIFPPSFNMSALLSIGPTCSGNTTDPASLLLFSSHRTVLVECRDQNLGVFCQTVEIQSVR